MRKKTSNDRLWTSIARKLCHVMYKGTDATPKRIVAQLFYYC